MLLPLELASLSEKWLCCVVKSMLLLFIINIAFGCLVEIFYYAPLTLSVWMIYILCYWHTQTSLNTITVTDWGQGKEANDVTTFIPAFTRDVNIMVQMNNQTTIITICSLWPVTIMAMGGSSWTVTTAVLDGRWVQGLITGIKESSPFPTFFSSPQDCGSTSRPCHEPLGENCCSNIQSIQPKAEKTKCDESD